MEYYGMPKEIIPQMQELLSHGEGFWLTVTGYSMTPTLLHMKDQVYISPFEGNAKKGDILLTRCNEENCLLHRVVKRDREMIYYRGDALNYCEGPLAARDVIGTATKLKRKGRIIRINALFNLYSRAWLRIWHLKIRIIRRFNHITKK